MWEPFLCHLGSDNRLTLCSWTQTSQVTRSVLTGSQRSEVGWHIKTNATQRVCVAHVCLNWHGDPVDVFLAHLHLLTCSHLAVYYPLVLWSKMSKFPILSSGKGDIRATNNTKKPKPINVIITVKTLHVNKIKGNKWFTKSPKKSDRLYNPRAFF